VGEAAYLLEIGAYSVSLPADTTSHTWDSPPCDTPLAVTLVARNAQGAEVGRLTLHNVATPACAAPELPDLVVVNLGFEPAPVQRGTPVEVNFLVGNQGNAASGPFIIRIIFPEAANVQPCSLNHPGLGAGARAGSSCTRAAPGTPGGYRVTAWVDVSQIVTESNEENNQSSATLQVTQ
jgi:hypothetical protein